VDSEEFDWSFEGRSKIQARLGYDALEGYVNNTDYERNINIGKPLSGFVFTRFGTMIT
jgi:hypothetical protein